MLKISANENNHNNSQTNKSLITNNPSNTSKGFENTFKLLEAHLKIHSEKSQQLKGFNEKNDDCNNICMIRSYVELEAEILQRLDAIIDDNNRLKQLTVSKTVITFLCDFVKYNQLNQNKFIESYKVLTNSSSLSSSSNSHSNPNPSQIEEDSSSSHIIYHAARKTNGKKYLRIVNCLSEVLCGNRVSQMTRAYDDIEAVTRLLEEKEKDLELTVQIGKELLTQNNTLENRIAELEADLKSSNEDRTQLVHELHKKIELISVLTTDVEDNSDNETPTTSKSVTLDLLQRKINSLQDENKTLKLETTQLVCQTDAVEAHEKQLMDEITTQLNEAHEQYNHLNYELERQREENRLQHEQIVSLTARLSEAEMRLHQLTHDNDEHITLLNITKENQNSLAMELVEFKQRYQEVLVLLQETQDQLRKYRKKSMPQARNTTLLSSVNYNIHSDSLQSELMESSIYSEMSMDSGISNDTNRLATIPHLYVNKGDNACDDSKIAENSLGFCSNLSGYSNSNNNSNSNNYNNNNNNNNAASPFKGVFDTIKIANKNCRNVPLYGALPANNTGGSSLISNALFHKQLSNSSASSTFYESGMGMKSLSRESLISHCENEYCPTQPAGVPGVPGAKELEAALKRLTPIEVMARRAMLSCSLDNTYTDGYDDNKSTSLDPLGIRTPESIMSTGSSGICSSAYMSSSINKPMINQWRLPQKLQIVKPLEGSHTLHNWLRLATPTLNAVLEDRPGITIRGGRGMDSLGLQTYTLSDVEEDVTEDLPGKQFENSACTFTYVTSTVMHPDDGFKTDLSFLTQSQVTSRMASASTSRQPSCPPTPRPGISRKNSCSTFSVNLGLASMLNERGIKAVTPSALNTPAGPNFSPTVTPCNSPEGTPVRSMSPEPLFSLLTSGADLIRRKFIGRTDATTNKQKQQQQKIMLNRLERRALRSLRLVERCEKIGLENIITTQSSALLLASGIANRSISPMAQLTSLKNLQSPKNCVVNDLHFDRHQIKDVLQRGLNTKNATTNANANALPERIETITATETTTTKALPGESDALWKRRIEFSDTEVNVEMDNDALSAMTSRDAMMMISTNKEENTSDVENVRIKQMQRQRSRHNMVIMKNGQRPDLGTLTNLRVRTDLGRVSPMFNAADNNANKRSQDNDNDNEDNQQTLTQTFVGTMSSLIFGRKGGWF